MFLIKKYTLIELIMVVSILGVLIGIVIPELIGATGNAKNVACKHNLHEIGLAISLYENDHRCEVMAAEFVKMNNDRVNFLTLLYTEGYMNNKDVFLCPSMEIDKTYTPANYNDKDRKRVENASYIMNSISNFKGCKKFANPYDLTGSRKNDLELPVKTLKIQNPHGKIFIVDAIERPDEYKSKLHWNKDMSALTSYSETDHGELPVTSGYKKRDVGMHHLGGSFNALYFDGHVETKKETEPEEWVLIGEPEYK
jgi:prepilin-type processing-associated H-X9-DG protein/prepilin-type N-terminal cleavage/methylation domain-containing protein